jgi:predicted Rossmann fold nucleotide-binding protein DprA/Smf involved in DNA uptake
MTTNQIKSWVDIQSKIKGRRKSVLDALKQKPMALFQLCDFLGWQINCISGRVSELSKMGIIEQVGSIRNPQSNKLVSVWGVKQFDLF